MIFITLFLTSPGCQVLLRVCGVSGPGGPGDHGVSGPGGPAVSGVSGPGVSGVFGPGGPAVSGPGGPGGPGGPAVSGPGRCEQRQFSAVSHGAPAPPRLGLFSG